MNSPEIANSSGASFRKTVLASGLLTEEQLTAALNELRVDESAEVGDAALAAYLVATNTLNSWQVEQLREGRTKFSLGPYRVIDSIGKGGMGHVFKGEHEMLGRIEAIKVLPRDRTNPDTIASFQKEIRAQAQLDHSNLVRVSYAGQEGDTYFLVTEYVPGANLRQLVRRHGRLTMLEAATIISQAAQGIGHAHDNGLIHRDVKPGNLLVTPEGKTKVTDLGLAFHLRGDDSQELASGKIVGTADYLAPEVIKDPSSVGPASDIYALGCTMYYAATGKVPFPGGTIGDKLSRHISERPLNPRRFNPDLSDVYLDVLADMMEKDPSKRIASMAEVGKRLRPWTLTAVAFEPNVLLTLGDDSKTSSAGSPGVAASPLADTVDVDSNEALPVETQDNPRRESQTTVEMNSWEEDTVDIDSGSYQFPPMKSRTKLPRPVAGMVALAAASLLMLLFLILLQSIF